MGSKKEIILGEGAIMPEESTKDKSDKLAPRIDDLEVFVNTDPQNWSNTQARDAVAIILEVLLLRDVQSE